MKTFSLCWLLASTAFAVDEKHKISAPLTSEASEEIAKRYRELRLDLGWPAAFITCPKRKDALARV
jgi:hypothetical protein